MQGHHPPVSPRDSYLQRLSARTEQLKSLGSRARRTSSFRLLVFLAGAAAIWFGVQGSLPVWSVLLPLAAFIALVYRQSQIERESECVRRAIRFNERGIARLEHRWQGTGESGERFANPHHPYSSDLDLFGRGSLFELLSTARTSGGEEMLADWLLAASAPDVLRERHAAIDELRPLIDLREQLAVLGDDFRGEVRPEHLSEWAAGPVAPFPRVTRTIAFHFSAVAAAMLLWWVSTRFVDPSATLGVVAIGMAEGALALSIRPRILAIVGAVSEPARDLDLLSKILAVLEKQSFQSPRLSALTAAIATSGRPASKRIAGVRRLVELLDSRDNVFLRIFGPPLLWTTQIGMAVEQWRTLNGRLVPGWIDAVSEMEALSALAGYAWEQPSDPFPEFAVTPKFQAAQIGHPLLPIDRSILNDVSLVEPCMLLVISGSNMSGKSTLLRAVGLNTVLALAGAPVRARQLILSPVALGASIRTTDSLEEGQSRFMAEILRLKQILDLPAPALFLLDELLNGTNSHDRAIGAAGYLRALLAHGAIGLATTHDLALTGTADELAPAAANVHFEDRLEGDRLVFDYTMRPGVVTRSNALDLMRATGLDV